jgi:hypothetical protein
MASLQQSNTGVGFFVSRQMLPSTSSGNGVTVAEPDMVAEPVEANFGIGSKCAGIIKK